MRINRFIASCGIASRRASEELIIGKHIKVNGKIVTDLSTQINDGDSVEIDGRKITPEDEKIYIIMNKPRGYLTTCSDDRGRRTVLDLLFESLRRSEEEESLRQPVAPRIFPVGRLDYDTEGLLILTNDGDFAQKLIHPKNEIPKVYRAVVDEDITEESLVELNTQADSVTQISAKELEITIHEGKNRQIRNMLASVGLEVTNLKRIAIGKLTLGRLKSGEIICMNKPPVIY